MFNIRNTQPSVSMQAIAGAAAPEASPEEIVWEKIQVFKKFRFFSRRKITKKRNSVSLNFAIRPGECCLIISAASLRV
ncbi:Hypothetical protein LTSESEN_1662 [Salmonella enterica subsp. enterica serovar Senftenberg str. A4-543]|uniref:Uncharacterized protein n=1 Tax=Salmonella enterica subsp. enterica serovar Senftenberg str. A4-543 TaxID=913082 RepID=G5QXX9_SALSE|nr:Hypothetical protein LTSESEN_1662 [Salmonella enterica subsp. enterica serovar Senftenberg str. A4-543]